jgi:phage/plasmid-like protein (TIGR03299 family)
MAHYHESSFVVARQAWHGLATVLEHAPSVEDALAAAGIDWRISLAPLTAAVPMADSVYMDEAGELIVPTRDIEIPSHRAVVRSTDGAILGVVGKDYKPFQNLDALQAFSALVNDGTLKIETAGSLQGGRKVWIQCRYADDIDIGKGDLVAPYILIAFGHDGKMSIVMMNTPTRVVCWNTMQAAGATEDAHAFDKSGSFRVPHVGDVKKKVAAARDAIVKMNRELQVSTDVYRQMARTPITEGKVREIARDVFDVSRSKADKLMAKLRDDQARRADLMTAAERLKTVDQIDELEKMISNWQPCRAEEKVVAAFHDSPGSDMAGATVWGAVNAATYHIDHGHGSRDSRMARSWFGTGAGERQQFFQAAAALL